MWSKFEAQKNRNSKSSFFYRPLKPPFLGGPKTWVFLINLPPRKKYQTDRNEIWYKHAQEMYQGRQERILGLCIVKKHLGALE